MLCDSTKTLLQTILKSLQAPDEAGWDDHIESGNQCLYEMHQMSRASYRAYTTTGLDKWPSHVPDGAGLSRAMPYVKAMMGAIRQKDRAMALENGKAALDAMNGVGHTRGADTSKELGTETTEFSGVGQMPSGKHRSGVKDRNSPRRFLVASGK
jgi:hypothetical protein